MNKKRFATQFAVVAGLIFLWAVAVPTFGQNVSAGPVKTPKAASPAAQSKKDSLPVDDFAGLDYSDEQKAEIDKIRRETKLHQEAVAKDDKLTRDQKDAMLVGYTRMEYGQVYRVLSPAQKKRVLQRVRTRRAADQAAHQAAQNKQPLPKQNDSVTAK